MPAMDLMLFLPSERIFKCFILPRLAIRSMLLDDNESFLIYIKLIVIFLKSQHFYLINFATYSQAMKESITVSILSRDGQIPVNLISTAEVIFCWWWVSHCFTASFIDMAFHILKKFQNPGGYYPTGSACLESIQSIWLPEQVVGFMEKIARYIVIYGRRCSF